MSDAVTNVDDVLSSIRRLVASGEGAHSAPPRLVLTPAQRVVPEVTPEAPRDPLVLRDPLGHDDADTAVQPRRPRSARPPAPDPVTSAGTPQDNTNRAIASLVEAIALAESQSPRKVADDIDAPTVERATPPASDDPAGDEPDFATRRQQLEATIAELEAAVADTDSEWEPDGSEMPPPEVLEWHDDVAPLRAAVMPDPAGGDVPPSEQAPASPQATTDTDDAQDDARDVDGLEDYLAQGLDIDGAELQRLVSEAVRAELQGVLGTRITRNVRKLVRREIYRILASEDLH